jgi:RHS repeat-associated protein
VVKDNGIEQVMYLYDLAGNLITEANLADGGIIREWYYVGSQRVAMIYPVAGGSGLPHFYCGACSLTGAADGGAAFLGFMGLVFLGIGVLSRRRKYTVAGLTFIGGVLFLVLMPEAKSQTPLPEQIYYYHNDHLGTPKVVTNQAKAVVWDADYSPFGPISSYVTNTLPAGIDQPFRFPGQYQDSITGLYYNWNRYYMPEEGRYNRVDLLKFSSCSLKSFDMLAYSYSRNNPIKYIDISGLMTSAEAEKCKKDCNAKFDKCLKDALNTHIECTKMALLGYAACLVTVAGGCAYVAPEAYPECLAAGEAACTEAFALAEHYCNVVFAGEIGACKGDLANCLKRCKCK